MPKYQDIPHTKYKSPLNYPTTPQPSSKPDIIPFGSHTSQASDGTPTSQIPPILWNPTSGRHTKREQKETIGILKIKNKKYLWSHNQEKTRL